MGDHSILGMCDRWSIGCLNPHFIDWSGVKYVAPLLLLHWIFFENMFWWITIVFIRKSNVSTCLNLVICRIPSNKSTCGSHNWRWDMGVKICLNSQWYITIDRVIADWYTKILDLLGFIKVFSILFSYHKPWPNLKIMTYPDSILYEVVSVHIKIFICW